MLTKSELKAWTDALRSGKYVQGTGVLKKKDQLGNICHCAIGVLCDINNVKGTLCTNGYYSFGKSYDDPYDTFISKVGMSETWCSFRDNGMPNLKGYISVAEANDAGVSFAEIADHLDKYYPAVEEMNYE